MSNFFELSATQIVDLLKRGETNPLEVLDHFTKRALDFGKDLGAVLYFNLEQARNLAQQLSENNSFKELPLAGLPISIKDNIAVSDNPLSCASNFLRSYRSSFNAEVISGILADGGIPFNKLNMDEFAMGSSNENSAFSVVKNPWNQEKVPGGSSGGSAAAVAAGITPLALGSDSGGSIRQPASFCGVCGYKPSYGMLSRFGLVAFASSLDQIGPFLDP